MPPVAVVAVGGNSLIRDNAHQTANDQRATVRETVGQVADMIARGWDVVLTHGNGPQVGLQMLRSELTRGVVPVEPLDICGADTQGGIGYMFQQALQNELRHRAIPKMVATVVTQTLVDAADPALATPTKPIGPYYTAEQARELQHERGWRMIDDAGRGWRRVVPSPSPCAIVERAAIEAMIRDGFVVISAGGGGIPVTATATGDLIGIEAVIDKDLGSSLLATTLHADLLLIVTGVETVSLNYRTADQQSLRVVSLNEARQHLAAGQFAAGSMEPKIRAAIGYVERGGTSALITSPEAMSRALAGETGTWILPNDIAEPPGIAVNVGVVAASAADAAV